MAIAHKPAVTTQPNPAFKSLLRKEAIATKALAIPLLTLLIIFKVGMDLVLPKKRQ